MTSNSQAETTMTDRTEIAAKMLRTYDNRSGVDKCRHRTCRAIILLVKMTKQNILLLGWNVYQLRPNDKYCFEGQRKKTSSQ